MGEIFMSTSSSHKGIGYNKYSNKWVARITVDSKRIEIGKFKTEEEAIKAYNIFIEQNKNSLSDRVKNELKREGPRTFERDEDGLIIRVCAQCGNTAKLKARITSDLCKSCSFKNTYKNGRTPNLYKKFDNIEDAIKDYESGMSLAEIGSKYGFAADIIQNKLIEFGYKTRTVGEAKSLSGKKYYSNIENRKKASARKQGIPIEKWEKFLRPENEKLWKNPEYKKWRRDVLIRDGYICQMCLKHEKEMHAHHILTKAKYPLLIFDINNGISVCRECHFTKLNNHEQEYEQFFLDLLCIK